MVEFQKMHHLGNNFIFFSELEEKKSLDALRTPSAVKMICDVKYGLGADGVVFLRPPENSKNNVRMQMFNCDGSEAELCGNALLGVGHAYLQKFPTNGPIKIETIGAIRELTSLKSKSAQPSYRIKLGTVNFDLEKTGDLLPSDNRKPLVWQEEKFEPIYAGFGNPHAVLFLDSPLSNDAMISVGAWLETHSNHPRRINVEFAKVINNNQVEMHVWERGCGMTNACGTGAAAVASTGVKTGKLKSPVTVRMPGGEILIEVEGETVYLTGTIQEVACGKLAQSFFDILNKK
ncbi:MAG: diaminopimelate epimerase [Candidatus Riflebacteria bacterium]|nr:diaminopimelate epimerase [Candidatus Riflebacteria bacterium]